MQSRIAILAPNLDVAEAARAAAALLPFPVEVHPGDLDAAVEAARSLLSRGPYVLVSRGGTARRLRRELNDVVVEIPVMAEDILQALTEAARYGRRVTVAGFPEAVAGTARAGALIGLAVRELPLDSEADYAGLQSELPAGAAEVVVGDTHVVRLAASCGLPAVLVRSSPAAVARACHEAMRLAQVRLLEQARVHEVKTVLQSINEGVVVVDQRGRITLFNAAAEGLLHRRAAETVGQLVRELVPELLLEECLVTGRTEYGRVVVMGKMPLVVTTIPVQVSHSTTGALAVIQAVGQLQRVEAKVRRELVQRGHVARTVFGDLVGASPPFREAVAAAKQYAEADSVVLLTGETGTGKELFAQSIHNASARREGPFVAVNCAAVPESLLESELFGYAEGAFTDARKGGKPGVFEQAHRGTLFLDEIGEMTPLLQARLLRVLQQREVMRLGDDRIVPVDVRVIAATNRDLPEAVQRGEFRADLYYRLNVLQLRLSPLRARRGDIALLAQHFLARLGRKYARPHARLAPELLAWLERWDWPGNVRELENLLERILVEGRSDDLGLETLVRGHDLIDSQLAAAAGKAQEATVLSGPDPAGSPTLTLAEALARAGGNKSLAARLLGIDRTTLWRRLRKGP